MTNLVPNTTDWAAMTFDARKATVREQWRGFQRRTLGEAWDIGVGLRAIKDEMQHGEWGPFCDEIGIEPETARRFMLLAAGYDIPQLEEFANVTAALKALPPARPKPEPPAEPESDDAAGQDDTPAEPESGADAQDDDTPAAVEPEVHGRGGSRAGHDRGRCGSRAAARGRPRRRRRARGHRAGARRPRGARSRAGRRRWSSGTARTWPRSTSRARWRRTSGGRTATCATRC